MTNPTPQTIGSVRFSQPRAVLIRDDPENFDKYSAVVSSTLCVFTDTRLTTANVINAWDEIVGAVNDKLNELFPVPVPATDGS